MVGRAGYFVPFVSVDLPWGHKILGEHHARGNLFDGTVSERELREDREEMLRDGGKDLIQERRQAAPYRDRKIFVEIQITADQADDFRKKGAVGSHLEILERNEGYKGFNQTGVSKIIAKTDPRKLIES